MKTFLSFCMLSVLMVVGCATPEARIKRNQELFETFSPAAQESIRAGKVEIGFTPDMATIALGEPDRTYTRRTATGVYTVWSYTDHYASSQRKMVTGTFRVRDHAGRIRTVNDSVWLDVPVQHEFERLRVEFENDQVVAVETLTR
jgi:hypothetical protein